jgi:hypothetical protein
MNIVPSPCQLLEKLSVWAVFTGIVPVGIPLTQSRRTKTNNLLKIYHCCSWNCNLIHGGLCSIVWQFLTRIHEREEYLWEVHGVLQFVFSAYGETVTLGAQRVTETPSCLSATDHFIMVSQNPIIFTEMWSCPHFVTVSKDTEKRSYHILISKDLDRSRKMKLFL